MLLDTAFDFRTDAHGRDPDSHSPMLRLYHQFLWSKPLPCGAAFDLHTTRPRAYLQHRSELGEFRLASDSVVPTFTSWKRMKPITDQISAHEHELFLASGYTMGGMLVFPGNAVDRKPTVNMARGLTREIADRMDLTLECIRRHYLGQSSPLSATLARYGEFFALFENLEGYVDFFLLQDLVEQDYSRVRFFLPFDDFATPSTPQDPAAYRDYSRLSIEFVEARNRRIDQWVFGAARPTRGLSGGRSTS